ncbi:MAG: PilC/PilY family type IV pilus protein, partial [Gammaproteobacteria bacterium]|nr:PilC/PilY family type IV pilus protein [Gammaproteobacteria bacterium]
EIYVGNLNSGNVSNLLGQPNILFVVDTSGSMKANVDAYDYISSVTYSGSFVSSSVYWSQSSAVITDPATAHVISAANFHCQAAQPSFSQSGRYFGAVAAWNPVAKVWQGMDPAQSGLDVECQGDEGVHGSNMAPTPKTYLVNGPSGPWSAASGGQVVWQNKTFYSGNYLNWNSLANKPLTGRSTRLGIVQKVVFDLINSANNINIGLMRFDSNSNGAEGGMIRSSMQDVVASRAGFIAELGVLQPGGGTPLSEVLYEAARYFRGEGVVYGINSNARVNGNDVLLPSVAASRLSGTETANPDSYVSPIKFECQKSSLIFLTDGRPTSDGGADSAIQALPGFATVTGQAACNGNCLDELAQYLYLGDQSTLPDSQNVLTYTIGFAFGDPALLSQQDQDALQLLRDTATKGGGAYFSADDTQGLTEAFAAIISDIRAAGSTFTAPTVPINAANRARHRNELYMTMFKPSSRPRWDGNLKKYRLAFDAITGNPKIVDANSMAAIDTIGSGELLDTAQSYWSTVVDGKEVVKGGFSSRLSLPRKMYTYSGVAAASNVSLAAITGAHFLNESNQTRLLPYLNMLATDANPTPAELLQWARGVDTKNEFNTVSAPGPRLQVSDPLHSQPAVITYPSQTALFFTTNSGYLHVVDESNGAEIFGFMPQELLPNLRTLYINNAASNRIYGLDGSVQTWVDDGGDGVVNLTDKAYLYFGMRRGGRNYYALDVTNPSSPVLKWTIKGGTGVFAELGQTWSDPVIKTIKYNGVATKVLIFAGGYDPAQDSNLLPASDLQGRAIYIVNAETGQRIWWAGPSGSGADLSLTDMTNSIPSKVNAIDLDGDGLTDRIYVGDTRAQLWRFDLNPNNTSAADLMTGGVIAKLGGAADVD